MFRSAPTLPEPPEGWWNSPWLLGLLVIAATIPLWLPVVPPLTDLMGHMGRYRIELSDPASPLRTRFYHFEWAFIANLGVDLLIVPMAALFGLELGVKLIVIAIPALTVTGILWIAREAHGRVPPTALFALPFAYSFPFIWGFLNYLLSMALALNAYGLWLRLGRQRRWQTRNVVFVVIGLALTVCHIFGWAVLCLLAFAAEVARARDEGHGFAASVFRGGVACLALAPPILLLVLWRSGDANGQNMDWFNWRAKYVYLISSLRTHWEFYDLASVFALWMLVVLGLVGVGLRMNRTLGIAAVLLTIAYVLLPRILLGSAYADMRLAPYVILIAVVALVPKSPSPARAGAAAAVALALFAGRLAMLTINFAEHDAANRRELAALDHVPKGSRVFVEVALPCLGYWETTRQDHLGAMAIVRRDAFVNGQWTAAGAQLLSIRYLPARGYAEDPTQVLRPFRCRQARAKTYPTGLNRLPRDAFDYVWLVAMPRSQWNSFPGLEPVWTGERSGILYRVVRRPAES